MRTTVVQVTVPAPVPGMDCELDRHPAILALAAAMPAAHGLRVGRVSIDAGWVTVLVPGWCGRGWRPVTFRLPQDFCEHLYLDWPAGPVTFTVRVPRTAVARS